MQNDTREPSGHAPIFVLASVRSGSTLLSLMLDGHPQIRNPGECDFLFDPVGPDGSLPTGDAYRDWLSTERIFLQKKLTLNAGLDFPEQVSNLVAQMQGDRPWLTMNVHRNFERIPLLFPQARYIYLLRDPRDVARSCIGMGWAGTEYHALDIWLDAQRSWHALRAQLCAGQFLELRYEDLVAAPQKTLRSLCTFIGCDYSDDMLDYPRHSSYGPPQPRLQQQWKNRVGTRELRLAEGRIGSTGLRALGYEPSGQPPILPAWPERLWLFMRNKQGKLRFRIARYGLRLVVQEFLARRLQLRSLHRDARLRIGAIDTRYLK